MPDSQPQKTGRRERQIGRHQTVVLRFMLWMRPAEQLTDILHSAVWDSTQNSHDA